jgi:hypothetical protein
MHACMCKHAYIYLYLYVFIIGMTFEELLDIAQGEEGVDMVEVRGGKMYKKFASQDDLCLEGVDSAEYKEKIQNKMDETKKGEKC